MWANGNGGEYDDCAADGYTQSIYTISVGAIGVDGNPSPFDEQCSAKMVTAYVTDPFGNPTAVIKHCINFDTTNIHSQHINSQSTTTIGGECTSSFGGTSASTAMVSGIIALTLETKLV